MKLFQTHGSASPLHWVYKAEMSRITKVTLEWELPPTSWIAHGFSTSVTAALGLPQQQEQGAAALPWLSVCTTLSAQASKQRVKKQTREVKPKPAL